MTNSIYFALSVASISEIPMIKVIVNAQTRPFHAHVYYFSHSNDISGPGLSYFSKYQRAHFQAYQGKASTSSSLVSVAFTHLPVYRFSHTTEISGPGMSYLLGPFGLNVLFSTSFV